MDITVTRFHPNIIANQGGSYLLGHLDIQVSQGGSSVNIRDFQVRKTVDGRLSISSPGKQYKNRDGESRQHSFVRFDTGTYEQLLKKVSELHSVQTAWHQAA